MHQPSLPRDPEFLGIIVFDISYGLHGSQPAQMESAIGIQHLARGEIQIARAAGTDESGHILRQTEAADRGQTIIDQTLVFTARRSAKRVVTMEMPALEMQYSPRLVEEV